MLCVGVPSEEEEGRQREPAGHMTGKVNVNAGKEKKRVRERNNVSKTLLLSLPSPPSFPLSPVLLRFSS